VADLGLTGGWSGRRVLLTGHTGFKGGWLAHVLLRRGAHVSGLALVPDTDPSLFDALGLAGRMDHAITDIRDPAAVAARVRAVRPEVVFHLAAQPLVLRSYAEPVETWATNVMGTLHLLAAVQAEAPGAVVVVVTTDKVYDGAFGGGPYAEGDRLGGHDPYAASKAGCEIAVASWRRSFAGASGMRLATARAGNVIGGGDWSATRLVPDLARAWTVGRPLAVRNPDTRRPWQHVLEPLNGYLMLAEAMLRGADWPEAVNFGPPPGDVVPVHRVIALARDAWPGIAEPGWHRVEAATKPHEAATLSLDSGLARRVLGWRPRWTLAEAVGHSMAWYRHVAAGGDARAITDAQIDAFEAAA
jgi:CDP-glucose 4,6-dehydratase